MTMWLDQRHLKYEHTKYIVFILTFSSAIIIIGVKHVNNCLLLTLTNNYIFHTMYLHGKEALKQMDCNLPAVKRVDI
jgi:hypothetical protein